MTRPTSAPSRISILSSHHIRRHRWRQQHQRPRSLSPLLPLPLPLLLVVLSLVLAPRIASAASACLRPSTLVYASSVEAIAYDELCTARLFRVRNENDLDLSLNLSHLNLARVESYPEVLQLRLTNNKLTTFQTPRTDSRMEELELNENAIHDLDGLRLPRRLTKLNLAGNRIALLNASVPWPAAFELKWLALDANPIQSVAADSFAALTALQYLSLSAVTLADLGDLSFPPSLRVLNLSRNMLTSETTRFSSPRTTLSTLDLSHNRLSKFPNLADLASLVDVNLASNSITSISGVRLPPKLKSLQLQGNALASIEIAASDVQILEQLAHLLWEPTASTATCTNAQATPTLVRGGSATVCVLSDASFPSKQTGQQSGNVHPPADDAPPSPSSSTKNDSSVLNDNISDVSSDTSSSSTSQTLSSKAVLVLGVGCFGMGLIVAAFVFLVRRERLSMGHHGHRHRKPSATAAALSSSSRSGRHPLDRCSEDDGDDSWVFESPVKDDYTGEPNMVAILEDDHLTRRRRGRGRSKLDDLLVYEIALDELLVKEPMAPLPPHGHHGHTGGEVMYQAEYEGYQVVLHALLRRKFQRGRAKRAEREFIAQARLASTLDHLCIVQFIGILFGSSSSSTTGTGAGTAVAAAAPKWNIGVVFEYMHHGSLAALFHHERTLREGKQFHRALAPSICTTPSVSGGGFSWYPSPSAHAHDSPLSLPHRCKLSIALDVAMALVYLHSMGLVHGDVHAGNVLLNDQGEAKLSAMDIDLALNNMVGESPHRGDTSMRASAAKAHQRVKSLFTAATTTSISQSPAALDSSHLHGGGGGYYTGSATTTTTAPPPLVPHSSVTSSSSASMMLTSLHTRVRRRGMQGDVYAFGLLLWELDTMMCMETMQQLTAATMESGQDHQMLRFSPDCPSEVQWLARRCWHPNLKERATALDLQEDLVRLLEGRLTTTHSVSERTHRWSRRTRSSAAMSCSSFASSGGHSHSHSSSSQNSISEFASSFVLAETDV